MKLRRFHCGSVDQPTDQTADRESDEKAADPDQRRCERFSLFEQNHLGCKAGHKKSQNNQRDQDLLLSKTAVRNHGVESGCAQIPFYDAHDEKIGCVFGYSQEFRCDRREPLAELHKSIVVIQQGNSYPAPKKGGHRITQKSYRFLCGIFCDFLQIGKTQGRSGKLHRLQRAGKKEIHQNAQQQENSQDYDEVKKEILNIEQKCKGEDDGDLGRAGDRDAEQGGGNDTLSFRAEYGGGDQRDGNAAKA